MPLTHQSPGLPQSAALDFNSTQWSVVRQAGDTK